MFLNGKKNRVKKSYSHKEYFKRDSRFIIRKIAIVCKLKSL